MSAPGEWVHQEGATWWREDIDAHVFESVDGVWWWAVGEGDSLRAGNADTREDAQAEVEESMGVYRG